MLTRGIGPFTVAADTGDVVVAAATMPGGSDAEADEERRKQRKDAGVSAILHEAYPVRYWDHDLGPAVPHPFWAGQLPAEDAGRRRRARRALRDLTPDAGRRTAPEGLPALPDGRLLARTEDVPDGPAGRRSRLVLTDTATARPVSVDDPLADVYAHELLPDGTTLVCVASRCRPTPSRRTTRCCWSTSRRRGAGADPDFDRWPSAPQFSADGSAVYFLADDDGRHAIFPIPGGRRRPVRLTGDGAYSDLQVARDGSALYALRSAYDSPSVPVRLDPERALQDPPVLPNPGPWTLPGTLHEVEATAADGARVQWLVLPRRVRREPRRPCSGSTAGR